MTLLLIYLGIAVGVSFLCSVLEAVLLSVTPSYTEKLKRERPRAGASLALARENLDQSLSAILILNTFAHTMGAAGVGAQALRLFGAQWETLIALVLTLIILYVSEIIPKTLGATFWRPLAAPAAIVINGLVKLVYPLVWLATRLTQLFSRKKDSEVTREEILAMAYLGKKDGVLAAQEKEYLDNVLQLCDIPTAKVYTPRSVVRMLQQDMSVGEVLSDPDNRVFSRMPLYGDDIDDVTGKVLLVDLYEAERTGHRDQPVRQFAKPVQRVSTRLPVHILLDRFIKTRAHLFLVEDEFGQTAGVVTLEDAIETLLGREIVDERDLVADMQALVRDGYRERLKSGKPETEAGLSPTS